MADLFRCDLIPAGSTVLCALSGGADSMYLLCRLAEAGYTVHAAHYNHGLRPTADRDEEFVRQWCADHAIPLTVGQGNVKAHAAESGLGIEDAARKLRYAFLEQAAAEHSCDFIATGHHAGDNAETVLMNLIRGCGLNGLGGIPEVRGNIVRPMLGITRQEINTWLAEHGIPHVEDETNADSTYTRNRIRHEILPVLEALNPQAVAHISAAAQRAAQDHKVLQQQAEELLSACVSGEDGVSVSALLGAPCPVALRALRLLAPEAGSVHLESMLALCEGENPSASLNFPGGTVRRVYDRLLVEKLPVLAPDPAELREGTQLWGDWHITCTPAVCPQKAYVDPTCFYLRTDCYQIRSRREGDTLRLGKRPEKTVKKLMIDGKIPRHLRSCVPVLTDGTGKVAAVGGLGPHREALAIPGEQGLYIIIRKEV